MKNIDIRQAISISRFKYFEVAEALGKNETSFSRLLRKELPEAQKREILTIIEKMKGDK